MGQTVGSQCTSSPVEDELVETDEKDYCEIDGVKMKSITLVQREGHPTVRVFEKPAPGATIVGLIPSNSKAHRFVEQEGTKKSFVRVKWGSIEGWVGVKNVHETPARPKCVLTPSGGHTSKPVVFDIDRPDEWPDDSPREADADAVARARKHSADSVGSDALTRTSARSHTARSVGSIESARSSASTSFTEPSGSHVVACPMGSKCKDRSKYHLEAEAHPFDPGYARLCEAAGLEPEEPSLLGLFGWVDTDGSGKVSLPELREAMSLISTLLGEEVVLTDKAWQSLDEDGNGCVNFSEFAGWAGPRLGLPLGVKHLFTGRAIDESHGCNVIGCPCEAFTAQPTFKDRAARTSTKDFLTSSRGKEQLRLCTCGHKFAAHNMTLKSEGEVPYPLYWDSRDSSTGEFTRLVPVNGTNLKLFQDLINETYSPVWTRDRKKHHPRMPNVPESFTVVRAFRSENSRIWREYGVKRAQLIQDVDSSGCRYDLYSDVLSLKAWAKCGGGLADRLKPEINEWYLFHGCSDKAAENICRNDFRLSMAGANTGTLYGRGIYFAESITKADEYAKANDAGEYTVILTRVVGGHVSYTDELNPDAEDLVKSCIEGPYDCIIGDRRKTKGTYREFVFYDTENFYAEYIIHYKRGKELDKRTSRMLAEGLTPRTPTVSK